MALRIAHRDYFHIGAALSSAILAVTISHALLFFAAAGNDCVFIMCVITVLYLYLFPSRGVFYIIGRCVDLFAGAAPNVIVFKRQRVRLLFLLDRIARGARNGVANLMCFSSVARGPCNS